ncbi:diguanylate cyclase domain-containing protein [Catenovulum sediminis]|uniref:Diguanylate cyclase n=1 Tax=Catenovulum sediminis TaxID=1740262 RepID=A0ABV1RKN0_9ALTE
MSDLIDLYNAIEKLKQATSFDSLIREAVAQVRTTLGFDRAGLLLYDAEKKQQVCTWGTDPSGQEQDEHGFRFPLASHLIMSPNDAKIKVDFNTALYDKNHPVGQGWLIQAAIFDGDDCLGWFFIDNLLQQKPLSDSQLDLVKVYSSVVGQLIVRMHAQTALVESEERLDLAIKGSNVGLWDWKIDKNHTYYSSFFKNLLGFQGKELPQGFEFIQNRVHEEDKEEFELCLQQHLQSNSNILDIECRIKTNRGDYRWFHLAGQATRNAANVAKRIVGSISDITEKKEAQRMIWQHANFDSLTGLPNRRFLYDKLRKLISYSPEHNSQVALMYLDLDMFKEVNDKLGHSEGDNLLKIVAARLKKVVRNEDVVARLGGDEFTVVMCGLKNMTDIARVANQIVEKLAQPIQLSSETVQIGVSIGIAFCPGDANDIESLFVCADQAMYRAKDKGRNQFQMYAAI